MIVKLASKQFAGKAFCYVAYIFLWWKRSDLPFDARVGLSLHIMRAFLR